MKPFWELKCREAFERSFQLKIESFGQTKSIKWNYRHCMALPPMRFRLNIVYIDGSNEQWTVMRDDFHKAFIMLVEHDKLVAV